MVKCEGCNGTGTVDGYDPNTEDGGLQRYFKCDECGGTGYIEYICPFCKEPNGKDEEGNCDLCSVAFGGI